MKKSKLRLSIIYWASLLKHQRTKKQLRYLLARFNSICNQHSLINNRIIKIMLIFCNRIFSLSLININNSKFKLSSRPIHLQIIRILSLLKWSHRTKKFQRKRNWTHSPMWWSNQTHRCQLSLISFSCNNKRNKSWIQITIMLSRSLILMLEIKIILIIFKII